MRVLLMMDPGITIPPQGYGGIERIIALLAKEYKKQGHDVEILASEGSYIEGCKMHFIGPQGFPPAKKAMNIAILRAWRFVWNNRNRFDLIHNFGRLLYLLPVLSHRVNKIMSYQREITVRNIRIVNMLPNINLFYTGCSSNLIERVAPPGKWKAVHNAVDFSHFKLTDNLPPAAPLIFLGRIERIKGCHIAIEVAIATGNTLVIAGNISKLEDEIAYFEKEIKPQIDGEQIMFLGEVNDFQKNEWLGKAKALLMPIEWDEPFGIVMIEAMACGTPVIAFKRGSVNEVVVNNKNGYIVDSPEEMINQIRQGINISRKECRFFAEERYAIDVIANQYIKLVENGK